MSDIIEKVWNKSAAWDGWVYTNDDQIPTFNPPTTLVATNSGTTNELTWTNGNASAQTIIERGPDGSNWPELILKDPGVTSHDDVGLSNGTYYYRARHTLNGLYSAYTSNTSATVGTSENSRTITGSGFGGEPTVLIFDRATGPDNTAYSLNADVGSWTQYKTGTFGTNSDVRYLTHAGRTWMAGRAPSQINSTAANTTGVTLITEQKYSQYYIEYRVVIPTGFCAPGAYPNVNSTTWTDTDSRWKLVWCWNTDYPATDVTDIVHATFSGGSTIALSGNGVRPRRGTATSSNNIYFSGSMFSAVEPNIFGTYVSEGTSEAAFDAVLETFQANGASVNRVVHTNARFWYGESGPLPALGHNLFMFGAWSGNINQTNVQHGWADMYLAVGPNSRARVYAHNAPTLAASTQVYNVTACKSAWSNSSITVSGLVAREALPYMSVISADGTLHQNVSWS